MCVAIFIIFFSAAENLAAVVDSGSGDPAWMAQDIEMGFPSPLSGSKEELEAFLDNLFAEEMARLHLPGAVIALVRDDEICLVKGYGYANLEKGVKADPERSIFRVGSVSKLFTAVAVMQLAEKKLVDLHTDVAAYQDRIKLESRSGRTVTLAHLLTHTGGFDEKYLGISAKERSRTTPWVTTSLRKCPGRSGLRGNISSIAITVWPWPDISWKQYPASHLQNILTLKSWSLSKPIYLSYHL